MTLLAAPRMVRLPATVLPAARAMKLLIDALEWLIIGKNRATKGTFEISWLTMILVVNIAGMSVRFPSNSLRRYWKKPVSQTLLIKTNIAAKNTIVFQSTPFKISDLLSLKINRGNADRREIYDSFISI